MQNPSAQEVSTLTGFTALPANSDDGESPSSNDKDEDATRALYFSVKKDQIVPILQQLMNRYQIVDMGLEEQSLEKVIQRLYEENA